MIINEVPGTLSRYIIMVFARLHDSKHKLNIFYLFLRPFDILVDFVPLC